MQVLYLHVCHLFSLFKELRYFDCHLLQIGNACMNLIYEEARAHGMRGAQLSLSTKLTLLANQMFLLLDTRRA